MQLGIQIFTAVVLLRIFINLQDRFIDSGFFSGREEKK